MAASSSSKVLSLYKAMLKESKKFTGYNFRNYALRRIKDAFRENKAETDIEKIDKLIMKAEENLGVIKRQNLITVCAETHQAGISYGTFLEQFGQKILDQPKMSLKKLYRSERQPCQHTQEYETSYETSDSDSHEKPTNRCSKKSCRFSSSSSDESHCCHDDQPHKQRRPTQINCVKKKGRKKSLCHRQESPKEEGASIRDISISIVKHHIEYKISNRNDDNDEVLEEVDSQVKSKCVRPARSSVSSRKTNIAGAIKALRQIRLREEEEEECQSCAYSQKSIGTKANDRQVSCRQIKGSSHTNRQNECEAGVCCHKQSCEYRRHRHLETLKEVDSLGLQDECGQATYAIEHPQRQAMTSSLSDRPFSGSGSPCESGSLSSGTIDEQFWDGGCASSTPDHLVSPPYSWRSRSNSTGHNSRRVIPSPYSCDVSSPLPPIRGTPKFRRKHQLPPLILQPMTETAGVVLATASPRLGPRTDELMVVPRTPESVQRPRLRAYSAGSEQQMENIKHRQPVLSHGEIAMPTWCQKSLPPISNGLSTGAVLCNTHTKSVPSPRPRRYRVFDFAVEVPVEDSQATTSSEMEVPHNSHGTGSSHRDVPAYPSNMVVEEEHFRSMPPQSPKVMLSEVRPRDMPIVVASEGMPQQDTRIVLPDVSDSRDMATRVPKIILPGGKFSQIHKIVPQESTSDSMLPESPRFRVKEANPRSIPTHLTDVSPSVYHSQAPLSQKMILDDGNSRRMLPQRPEVVSQSVHRLQLPEQDLSKRATYPCSGHHHFQSKLRYPTPPPHPRDAMTPNRDGKYFISFKCNHSGE